MAILFADGFEDGAEADYPGANTILSTNGGRRSSKSLTFSASGAVEGFSLPSSVTTVFASLAVFPNSAFGCFFSVLEDYDTHVTLLRAIDGAIIAFRGSVSTELGRSAAGVFPDTGYTSIQCKIVIHDTTGSVEVRLNGSSTPVLNLTNVDTRVPAGISGVVSRFQCGGSSTSIGGSGVHFDDVVVWDTSGSVNNSWLGDLRVDSYLPSADGDTVNFTTSTGSTHYTLVDEVPSSGTDYTESGTLNHKELFQMANMSHTPVSIQAVVPVANLLKDDAGTRSGALMVKSNGTESVGSNIAPSTTTLKYARVVELNPDGSVAWTKSAVDALQVGVKVTV